MGASVVFVELDISFEYLRWLAQGGLVDLTLFIIFPVSDHGSLGPFVTFTQLIDTDLPAALSSSPFDT